MENHENKKENGDVEKLNSSEFFTLLEELLKKAPDDMVYLINAMENPESEGVIGKSVIAVSGSCAKIAFAFNVAFKENKHYEHIVGHAVDYSRFMKKSRSPFGSPISILEELLRR